MGSLCRREPSVTKYARLYFLCCRRDSYIHKTHLEPYTDKLYQSLSLILTYPTFKATLCKIISPIKKRKTLHENRLAEGQKLVIYIMA